MNKENTMREAIIRGVGFEFYCDLGVGVGIVSAVQSARDSAEVPEELKDGEDYSDLITKTYFTGQDLLDFIKKCEANGNLSKGTYDSIAPLIEVEKFYKAVAYDD